MDGIPSYMECNKFASINRTWPTTPTPTDGTGTIRAANGSHNNWAILAANATNIKYLGPNAFYTRSATSDNTDAGTKLTWQFSAVRPGIYDIRAVANVGNNARGAGRLSLIVGKNWPGNVLSPTRNPTVQGYMNDGNTYARTDRKDSGFNGAELTALAAGHRFIPASGSATADDHNTLTVATKCYLNTNDTICFALYCDITEAADLDFPINSFQWQMHKTSDTFNGVPAYNDNLFLNHYAGALTGTPF